MPPTGIIDNGDDVVIWAHRVGPDSGGMDAGKKESARVEWQIQVNHPATSYYDIVRSPKLPQIGEVLKHYLPPIGVIDPDTGYPIAESTTYSYVAGETINSNLAVINYQCQQSSEDPYIWRVTVIYEGITDPTAQPSEVSSEDVEYQTHENLDLFGRVVANSAFDPIMGGMPVDQTYKVIRITRAIPYDLWDMRLGEEFKNTINFAPFVLSRQKRWVEVPDPENPPDGTMMVQQDVVYPRGAVRIKRITETEITRTDGPDTLTRKRYWRVTAELHIDLRTIRLSDGTIAESYHRYVVADMGFAALNADNEKTRIRLKDGSTPTDPQFLDGKGHWIKPAPNPPEEAILVAGPPDPSQLSASADYYATADNTMLDVPAPGVLWNDPSLTVGTTAVLVEGPPAGDTDSFSLNANGSFTFKSKPNVAPKWVTFRYKAVNGGQESPSTAVHILVNALPRWLAFDRYKFADWTPLAPLLANW